MIFYINEPLVDEVTYSTDHNAFLNLKKKKLSRTPWQSDNISVSHLGF